MIKTLSGMRRLAIALPIPASRLMLTLGIDDAQVVPAEAFARSPR
jgi:hypothetical protein